MVATLPDRRVTVLAAQGAVACVLPDAGVTVSADSPPISVTIGDTATTILCDDVIAASYTTPTLTSWEALATDEGANGITVEFLAVTAGSPCRVRFKLVAATANDLRSIYTSPEQNTPHEVVLDATTAVGIIDPSDRGLTYDLYWGWTSGSETGAYALVAAAAIYIPNNGEGDFPASG